MTVAASNTRIQVSVLFFSILRERLGRGSTTLELADSATVSDLLDALEELHPDIHSFRGVLRVARNAAYASGDERLMSGDEVAIITPVSGG